MTSSSSSAASTTDREIVTTRLVRAPRELVWDAWTDPDRLGVWWGPNGFTTTTHAFDMRPGGTWRFTMHGPDGTDYANEITYEEIAPPERIAYEHGDGTEDGRKFWNTITFEEEDGGTRVTMRALFATASEREYVVREVGAIEGGKQTLARMAEFVEERNA